VWRAFKLLRSSEEDAMSERLESIKTTVTSFYDLM
jgi:hypothetical protein